MLEKYFARPLLTFILRILFRMEVHGLEHYRRAGSRCLIVANHVSYLDPLLLGVFLPDKPAFAINVFQAKKWYLRWLRLFVRLYELDPSKPLSMKSLIHDLRKGARVVLFPEGRISTSGGIMKVYDGASLLVEKTGCAVLPVCVSGAERTRFSRMHGKMRLRWLVPVKLTFLPPLHFQEGDSLSARDIYDMLVAAACQAAPADSSILSEIIASSKRLGASHGIALDGISRELLTYRKLLTKSFVLSAKLEALLGDERYVASMLPTSAGAAIVLCALHMAGRVPCLLNFSAGSSALGHACMLAGVKTVLTSRAFIEKAQLEEVVAELAQTHRVIYLEDLRPDISLVDKLRGLARSFQPARQLRAVLAMYRGDAPAVVLYTSGSEGMPKGVALSHRNILSNIAQFKAVLDLNPSDTLFNALPVFHSFGLVVGTLTPLTLGIRAVFYPSPLHYRVIPEMVYDTDSTIMLGTDTFYQGYARYAHPYDFWRVRLAVAGAEKLKESTRTLYHDRFNLSLTEGYGVTETSPVLSVNTPLHQKKGSVGRLLPMIEYRLEPVEGLAEGGRLLVRGPNVMLGYLKADQPGVIQPTDEWYDTGDIVRVDEEGFIYILGRAKRFAKIGGEMVSLLAVEEFAASLEPEVCHAAIAIADDRKGEQVLLYSESRTLTREGLIREAQTRGIAEIMLPRQIRYIESIPRLGNGKVDFVTLKRMAGTDQEV